MDNPYDIIIIGAGTAGLTAAIYACRAKKSVLVIEKSTYGGQIINTGRIENYPAAPHISGPDFAKALYEQAESFGANFEFETVENITIATPAADTADVDTANSGASDADAADAGASNQPTTIFKIASVDDVYYGRAVIIATGSADRHLGLENEDALIGRGVSYCATCDGNFFKDQDVAVNGGGNTAMWDALYLADLAKTVTVIHRRDTFRADSHLVDMVRAKKNVKFILNSNVTALNADENHKLSSITLTDNSGQTTDLPVAGLFVAIGRVPSNDFVKDLVNLDDKGYVISDESCETNVPGVFVAGDNRAKEVHQLVTATSDGAIAATAAINYLRK